MDSQDRADQAPGAAAASEFSPPRFFDDAYDTGVLKAIRLTFDGPALKIGEPGQPFQSTFDPNGYRHVAFRSGASDSEKVSLILKAAGG